jgi:Ca2+-binding RTX toxin-like protein
MRRMGEAGGIDPAVVAIPHRLFAVFPGTGGNDAYTGTDGADTINGGAGNDTLNGAGGDDVIFGDEGDDTLSGGNGYNTLNGGAGDDRFYGTGGADTIDGGTGYDIWYGNYETFIDPLRFNIAEGRVSRGTRWTNVERAVVTGGYGADAFFADGHTYFTLDGGGGEDTLNLDFRDTRVRREFEMEMDATGISAGDIDVSGSFTGMERVTIQGYDRGTNYSIVSRYGLTGAHLSIAGGEGYDTVSFDFSRATSVTLAISEDGKVGNWIFEDIERYGVALGSGANHVTMTDGVDWVSVAAYARAGTTHMISTLGGNDSIVIGASSGIATIDGGDGIDSLRMSFSEAVTFDDRTGAFSNGSSVKNIEEYVFASFHGTLHLGTGADIYAYSNSGASIDVIIDRQATSDAVRYEIGYEVSFLETVVEDTDSVQLRAGSGDDYVNWTDGRSLSADGGAGTDTLRLSTYASLQLSVSDDGTISGPYAIANFEIFTIGATAGSVIETGAFADEIVIYGGRNTLSGGGGDDVLTLYTVRGYATGTSTLFGGGGDDTITSDRDADLLHGGDGDDIVRGGDGADRAWGDAGDDLLQGGLGDDWLAGGAGADIVDGQDGVDIASYADAGRRVVVSLAISAQQNTRGGGLDLLVGVEGLEGSAFADVLTGNAADNRIIGGAGADRVTGGGGADTFAFASLAEIGSDARDRILDFSHAEGDRIDLSAIDPDAGSAGDQAFSFIGTAAFSGDPGAFEVRTLIQKSGDTLVLIDMDHDAKADHGFVVATNAPLTAADFIL